jgi:hypothetical protein
VTGAQLLCGFLLVATVTWLDPAATLADERTCELDPDTGQLKCVLVAQPAPAKEHRLAAALPLVWHRVPMQVEDLVARGVGCVRDVPGGVEIGAGYVVWLENEVIGLNLYLDFVCQWPGEDPPEPPPPPPTEEDFRAAYANTIALSPSMSPGPAIGGLTGLDSWFWCTDPGPVAVDVNLRGWTAAGEVEVVQVAWEVGGPDGVSDVSTSCGSEDAPSVTWTPETMGAHSIALTSTWAGTWALTWNGILMGSFPLGPVSLGGAPQPYPVDEYRGVLSG